MTATKAAGSLRHSVFRYVWRRFFERRILDEQKLPVAGNSTMEMPFKELPMMKIISRSRLRNRKLAATGLVVAALAATCVDFASAQGAATGDVVLPQTRRDAAKELAMKITEPFTFAAVGDIIIRRPVGPLGERAFRP